MGNRHLVFQPQAQPLGSLTDGTGLPDLPQAYLGNAVALVTQVDQGQLAGSEVGMDQDHTPPLRQGLAEMLLAFQAGQAVNAGAGPGPARD